MKKIVFAALLFATGCIAYEQPREATEMSTEYTPVPANNPATITLPSDGDNESAESVNNGFRDLADKDSRKVDGTGGGTYAPSTPITIGGSGLVCTVSADFQGLTTFTGTSNARFFGAMECGASGNTCTIKSPGHLLVKSGAETTFEAGTAFTMGSTMTCTGAVAFTATNLVISGASWAFQAGATVTNATSFTNTGAGHIVYRYGFGVTFDADVSFGVNDYDAVTARSGSLAATRNWTVLNTGAVRGAVIEIANDDFAAHRVDIFQHDGTTLIASLGSAFDFFAVKLINDGLASATSSWQILSATHTP